MEANIIEPTPDDVRKRILGHAAGKILFTDGWEKPLTEAELLQFIAK